MGFQLINDAYQLAPSVRNALPELRVSRITLLNFTMTAPDMPTARSAYPGDFVTDHEKLIEFLGYQQKQIHLLEAHVRNLAQGIIAISGSSSNARLQAIPDSRKEEKPTLAAGQRKLTLEQAELIVGLLKSVCVLEPIAVSERLPGPEDCQFNPGATIGSCWWWNPSTCTATTGYWSFEPWEWAEDATHWLPAYSLPIPEQL